MQVADEVGNIKTGVSAMQAAGAQPEFIAMNMIQAQALNSPIILRAGSPPVYNRQRSPKSGLNKTKTSNQGFFKGALAAEERFTRVKDGKTLGHDKSDAEHLKLSAKEPEYQHTVQLSITVRDILREVGPEGDFEVLGYDENSGALRMAYKEGKGSPEFKGQFIINLNQGTEEPQFYSRPWDRPQYDPNWDPEKYAISKPEALDVIPDDVYYDVFNQVFDLTYSETQDEKPADIKPAQVMANRPRTPKDFIHVMGTDHPSYMEVKAFEASDNPDDMEDMLSLLDEDVILGIYDESALVVAGDWDGLAISHPVGIKAEYKHIYNTFSSDDERDQLLAVCGDYLQDLKDAAQLKDESELSKFDSLVLEINEISDLITPFSLNRAGRITAHEFLFQQLINYAYRDEANQYYGESFHMEVLQQTADDVLNLYQKFGDLKLSDAILMETIQEQLKTNMSSAEVLSNISVREEWEMHLFNHLKCAIKTGDLEYKVPHPQHDQNTQDLYQHGFDVHNPFGSNLEGPWLMVTPDGGVIYGEGQETLVAVLMTGDFLEKHQININHGANMSVWSQVIARQIELGQSIPHFTKKQYDFYKGEQEDEALSHELFDEVEFEVDDTPFVTFEEEAIIRKSGNMRNSTSARIVEQLSKTTENLAELLDKSFEYYGISSEFKDAQKGKGFNFFKQRVQNLLGRSEQGSEKAEQEKVEKSSVNNRFNFFKNAFKNLRGEGSRENREAHLQEKLKA